MTAGAVPARPAADIAGQEPGNLPYAVINTHISLQTRAADVRGSPDALLFPFVTAHNAAMRNAPARVPPGNLNGIMSGRRTASGGTLWIPEGASPPTGRRPWCPGGAFMPTRTARTSPPVAGRRALHPLLPDHRRRRHRRRVLGRDRQRQRVPHARRHRILLVLLPGAPQAKQLRVTVSTLWEAAWALIDIPGRPWGPALPRT
jgi:hypothetical protein